MNIVRGSALGAQPADRRHGAYGLTWSGLTPDVADLVSPAPASWTTWHVEHVTSSGRPPGDWHDQLTATGAVVAIAGGIAHIDRKTTTTRLSLPHPPTTAELTHPFMAATAAVAAHWRGEVSFHCAAFEVGGQVWAIVGDREAGKSTTVAALWREGTPIICDDLLVIRERTALAGPRSLDLRRPTAEWLGAGTDLGVTGMRERWRIRLSPVAPELPFGGFVVLDWGPDVRVEPVAVRDRPDAVMAALAVLTKPEDLVQMLDLFSLPTWRFVRPRRLDALVAGVQQLCRSLR